MMMLLNVTGQLAPSDSKHHITYEFRLDKPATAIRLRFAYWPKLLKDEGQAMDLIMKSIDTYIAPEHQSPVREGWRRYLPLKNLITLSMDDPNGYRGSCHRHDAEQNLFLSEQEASEGLLAGKLDLGQWNVTVSAHAVITDRCSYELSIWTEEADTACDG
ncbi:hypothetical protein SAMN04487895_110175 [Paenibacillus sophorae]|uniref:Uncharacterized protein n=1 Tax=Paenibacillus sophorae TaxID=1333845 RepID=A0A1H8RZ34_9BACL|nr:hypothetical protein [Paenibacillus sophorae]QWU16913.1 hypothetical protein KP014_06845 [Paenibacillus sophorae]SEO71557.1 hypothetical protein SAMN04487895_110175 [Paenibacillus sophorae]